MDRTTIAIDSSVTRLRRVGRLARRRMRIDGAALANGLHTDGTLTVEISGLGSPVAGVPDLLDWVADRPIALVIVRAGIDGEDVAFEVGPTRSGHAGGASLSDGAGIRYIAFCYDAAPNRAPIAVTTPSPVPATVTVGSPDPDRVAAAHPLAPTRRERRSILDQLLHRPALRRPALRRAAI